MTNNAIPTRPHNLILDGLRGVAAKIVIAFHLCELHATSHITQLVNHGYLAVGGDVDCVHASTRTVVDGYSGMAGNASVEVITSLRFRHRVLRLR